MSAYLVANPPARSQFRANRRQTPSGVIVIHTAENAPDTSPPDSGAENVASFIRRRTDPGSYHDIVDSDSRINLVPYSSEAYHDGTGTNPHSLSVSVATQAHRWAQLPAAWVKGAVDQAAWAAAAQAHWLAKHYGIVVPARRITAAQARNRVPGFTTHAELDPGRRSDPGAGFPWQQFLDLYSYLTRQLRDEAPKAAPSPQAIRAWTAGVHRNQVAGMPNMPNANMGLYPAALRRALEFATGHDLVEGRSNLELITYGDDLRDSVTAFQRFFKLDAYPQFHQFGAFHEIERWTLWHVLDAIRIEALAEARA